MNPLRDLLESINTKLDQILIVMIDNNKVNSIISSQIDSFFNNVEIHTQLSMDPDDEEPDDPWKDDDENENPSYES